MRRKLKQLFSLIFLSFYLCSCTGGVSDDEIIAAVRELAPRAKEIYEIVYGDSFKHGPADDTGYCLVDENAEYNSVADISASIYEIFTPEYGQIIENTAFRGVESDEGYIGPKFVERDGLLYVNPSATNGFSMPREFDTQTADVNEKNIYMAVVTLGHENGNIEVTLQYMDGKWLIDSPLY